MVVAFVACAGYPNLPGAASTAKQLRRRAPSPATRVVDGDTFWRDSADRRIRVWGLDAGERDEPGGTEATAALTALIAGRTLTCWQRDTDRYGRTVGQCFLSDGRDVAAVMIESGAAESSAATPATTTGPADSITQADHRSRSAARSG